MNTAASSLCPHAEICSGCRWLDVSADEQRQRKIQHLAESLKASGFNLDFNRIEIEFLPVGPFAFRNRLDLTYSGGQYGFFRKDSRDLFDLQVCPLLTRPLQDFYSELRKIPLPLQKGSLRLRSNSKGERGLWLDFANEDVRDLLAEQKTLRALMDLAFIEIGQKRKHLVEKDGALKLVEPEYRLWTQTWAAGKSIPLFSLVGGFSQSGDLANQILVQKLESYFNHCEAQDWLEFGCGNGNLSFALADRERKVQALEFDALALQGLEMTLQSETEFQKRILPSLGNFQKSTSSALFQDIEGVLVNPPRSGLMAFLQPLQELPKSKRPRDFVYMSCFLESFLRDSLQLKDMGYEIQELSIVDQFPHTPHFEILSRWNLN